MELDLQSLLGLNVQSCNHWPRPHTSPPRIWATRALYRPAKIDGIFMIPFSKPIKDQNFEIANLILSRISIKNQCTSLFYFKFLDLKLDTLLSL
jgi:hypothetical protein